MEQGSHAVFKNTATGPWLVELRGDQHFLGELFENFSYQELGKDKIPKYFLEQVYGQIFLRSQTFDRFTDPREVQKEGRRLLHLMNGILKLQAPGRSNDVVDVGAVFVEESFSRFREPIFGFCPQPVAPYKSSPLESSKLLELSDTESRAECLLQLYGSCNPVWWTFLKMMEIIALDMQEYIPCEGLPSKEKLELLKVTSQMNSPENKQKSKFPFNPGGVPGTRMPLIEARLIMHSLLEGWINWRLSHMPRAMALSHGD